MRTKRYLPGKLLMLLMATALLGSCAKETMDGGEPLPEGKYPVEFTTQMYDMEVTRATTDNKWDGDGSEKVAVKVDTEVKQYVADKDDNITADKGVTPFYWTKSNESKTVTAYYPFALASASSITVKTDQDQAASYQASDALYAAPATFAFADATKQLTFHHLTAKVVANLKAGDGVTDAEVQGATVKFVSQSLTATFDNQTGAVTAAQPGNSQITPNALSAASNFQKSVQALLVPCQMQGKQFIAVTIGSDTFYYTPANATDGLLASGKVYTYEITVKRNDIEVTFTESSEWTNEGNEDIASEKQ